MQEIGPSPPRASHPGEWQQRGRNDRGASSKSKMKKPAAVQKTLKKPAGKWSHDRQIWGEKIGHGLLTATRCGVLCLFFFVKQNDSGVTASNHLIFLERLRNQKRCDRLKFYACFFPTEKTKTKSVVTAMGNKKSGVTAQTFLIRGQNRQRWASFIFSDSRQRCARLGFLRSEQNTAVRPLIFLFSW